MKSNSNFQIFGILAFLAATALLTSCKKEETPINRNFDPTISEAVIVSINKNEIGGSNLILNSFRDDESPLIEGKFNTVVSKEGEQLLTITDENNNLRALTLSTPSVSGSEIMQIDAHSTAMSVVYMSPGILSTDPLEAKENIDKIQKLGSFTSLESYLKINLKSNSLKDLISTPSYDTLLNHCVMEYYQKYCMIVKNSSKSVDYNLIELNQISQKKIEIKNKAYRYVSVVQRDMNSNHLPINQKILKPDLKGAIPWSWGSLFKDKMMDPTVEVFDYIPSDNSSISEFWFLGMGQPTGEIVPDEIRSLNRPIVETLLNYAVFPILDLVSGTDNFIDYADSDIKDLIRIAKLDIALFKTATAQTVLQFEIAAIDDVFKIIGVLASMSTSSPIALSAAAALATVQAGFSAINFGAFAGSVCWCDNYSSIRLLAYNQPPTLPMLKDPLNNSNNLYAPIVFHWSLPPLSETCDFQISKYNTFSPIYYELLGTNVSGLQINTIEKGVNYFWRVRAHNSYGYSWWSEVWSFKTAGVNESPSIPTSPFPADGATGVRTAITLTWSCTDPDVGDQITYDVLWGTTETDLSQIATDLTSPSISRGSLSQGIEYFWKIVAKDNHGNSTQGPVWRFKIGTVPDASFIYSPNPVYVGQVVQFTNKSSSNATSWEWEFGDGSKSSLKDPQYTFTKIGKHTVVLTAINIFGWSVVYSEIDVKAAIVKPAAAFLASPTTIKVGEIVDFTDQSTNNPTSWLWNFGDGGTSTTKNPSHKYSTAGTFTVALTATNSAGYHSETKSNYITVNPDAIAPVAAFSASQTTITKGQSVQFTDQSVNNPTSWLWNFGDGGTSTIRNPSHIYNAIGTFTVSLTASNASGNNSITKNNLITVNSAISTVNDIEGNVYNVIILGTQVWLKENLKTITYNDGSKIPMALAETFVRLTSGAYCWPDNDIANKNVYGALYNWYTVSTNKLCPSGWHVPSDSEWNTLELFLGMTQTQADGTGLRGTNEGGKIKESGTVHWLTPNLGATNESGFTALPSSNGFHTPDRPIGSSGFWWSSTSGPLYGWHRALGNQYSTIWRGDDYKYHLMSVRCVKD